MFLDVNEKKTHTHEYKNTEKYIGEGRKTQTRKYIH